MAKLIYPTEYTIFWGIFIATTKNYAVVGQHGTMKFEQTAIKMKMNVRFGPQLVAKKMCTKPNEAWWQYRMMMSMKCLNPSSHKLHISPLTNNLDGDLNLPASPLNLPTHDLE
ncbi:unnamed protein product, partial [Dovyalis caffra]